MTSSPASVSFDNTEIAFAYKSDKELKQAHWLFSSMQYSLLVNWGTRLTPWAIRAGMPVKSLIRNTLFKQFVGGETLGETAAVATRLGKWHVQVILDYGVEGGDNGEEGYNHACDEFLRVIDYAGTQPNIPFMSVKMTGLARFSLLEKLDQSVQENAGPLMKRYASALERLTDDEKAEWQRVYGRIEKICSKAVQKNVGVFIDAEETWIQDPVDVLCFLMMEKFNREKALVFNTYQLYRTDRLPFLHDSLEAAQQKGFILGAKLVRGAYMEKERERAAELGYPSPIQTNKEACDLDYDNAVLFCIENIDRISLVLASHNENSNLNCTRLMDERNIPHNHPHVHFSQLYGMSDNISFNLANAGFSVSKYLPFGPISEVVPYLMRRARENSSVSGQTGRELTLISKELKRRRIK
jgi:proline dehydrogenase